MLLHEVVLVRKFAVEQHQINALEFIECIEDFQYVAIQTLFHMLMQKSYDLCTMVCIQCAMHTKYESDDNVTMISNFFLLSDGDIFPS